MRLRQHRLTIGLCLTILLPVLLAIIADRLFPLPLAARQLAAAEAVDIQPVNNRPVGSEQADRSDFAQVITDRHGQPLRAFADHNGVWRYPVRLEQVAPDYLQALLAYEDRWFYRHPGINPLAMARASWQNLRCACVISGGSTLTMQVARLLSPHSRTLGGKLSQILRALQLEWHLSKAQILTLYLNYAPMGGVIEGVEAASRLYLGKSARELSLAESALLAVLPQTPSRLRPDRYPQRAQAARDKVLKRLFDFNLISQQQWQDALLETVVARDPRPPIRAPLLARQLHQQYPQQAVIRTSVDGDLQDTLESQLQDEIRRFPPQQSAAMLVVDNHSHQVLAYVGSADFFNHPRFGHVDMVQAMRSPGSTLKPVIYGLALEDGLIHSASLLSDIPRNRKDYRPENFARHFSGATDPHTALRHSLNLPSVQVLEALTPERFAAALANVRTPWQLPHNSQPNLALALGGGGFNLWQLVTLYSGIANGGQVYPLQVLANPAEHDSPRWLFSAETAWVVSQLLRNPRPDRVRSNMIHESLPLAWKTGTSYGFRDAWAVGYTPRYTMGIWLGRPDGTPSPGQFGALDALPLLFRLQQRLDRNPQWPSMPTAVTEETICWPLGLRRADTAAEHCDQQYPAWIIRQQVPPTLRDETDGLMPNPMSIRVSADGRLVSNDCSVAASSVRKLALWPRALEPWLPQKWRLQNQLPPLHPDCPPPDLPVSPLHITGLEAGTQLAEPAGNHHRHADDHQRDIRLNLGSIGGYGSKDWYLNGIYSGSSEGNLSPAIHLTEDGDQELVIIDQQGNSDRLDFRVN